MDNNEIEIRVTADVSDLEKSVNEATKKVDKQADKMEKSFNDLSKSLDKVKANMNNAFNSNNTNLNGLTNQLNKLTNVATNVANKVQSALKKAFNVEGKVTVKQDVQTTNTTTNANGNGGALADALLTGGTIGALMNKELAQMNRNINSSIPKSFKGAIDKSEGMFSRMGARINKVFSDLANAISDGTIGKVEQYTKLSEDLKLLQDNTKLTKTSFNNLFKLFEKGVIQASTLNNALKNTKNELINLQKESKARGLSIDFDEATNSLQSVIMRIKEVIKAFNNGKINESIMAKQIMALKNKVNEPMKSVKSEIETNIEDINKSLASIDTETFGFKIGKRLSDVGNKTEKSFNKIQTSVDKLKARLADTTIGKGLVHINTTIKEKVVPSFKVLQERCKQLMTFFKDIGSSAKKMGNDTKKATDVMKGGFGGLISMLAPFLSIFAVFNGIKTSITSYVDSMETVSKFQTVFGNMSDDAQQWADTLSSSVAVSKASLMDGSANLMAIAKSMGLGSEEAFNFSKSLSEMAVDLNSFNNIEDGLDRIRSGVLGEYESLKSVGIILSEDAVKAKMLAMGIDETSNSSKMLARQQLILEQMMASGAFGNARQEASGLSAQLKMLQYNFQALAQSIGACFGGLLQVLLPIINRIVQALTVAFNKIANCINELFRLFGINISTGGGGGGGVINEVSDVIDDVAISSGDIADNFNNANQDAKEMAKSLASFDKLNVLNRNTSSTSNTSGGGGSTVGGNNGGSSIGNIGNAINNSVAEATKGSSKWAQQIYDAIVNNPYFKSLKENFFGLVDACKNFVKSAGGWLRLFMDSGGREFLNNLGDCAFIIGDILITALKDGVTWITNFLNSAKGQAVIRTLGELCKWLSERLKDILLWIRDNKEMLYKLIGVVASVKLGFAAFVKVAQGISAIKTGVGLVKTALGKLPAILKGVKGAWETMQIVGLLALDKIKLAFPGLLSGAKSMLSGAVSAIGSAISAVAGALGISAGALVAIVVGVIAVLALVILNWDKVKEWGIKAWNGIKAVWSTSNQWCYNNIVSPIINHFRNLWNTARDLGTRAWDGIKNTWQGMASWYGSLGQRVSQHFSNMWQSIRNGGQSAWQYLQRVFNSGGSFFRDITSSMGNAFKQVLNIAIRGINNIIGIPFRGINSAIRGLKNVNILGARPFQFLRELNVPQIPYLASGGIVDSATLAMIGEGRQNEAVIPLDTFYNKLSQMFADQNRMLIQSMQNGNGNATIILQMDGKEVARGTVNNMKEMSKLGQLDMSWL